jgi:signal transduction histidine kinase
VEDSRTGWQPGSVNTRRRWLLPVGVAVIALVVAATMAGEVGVGTTGRPLLAAVALACYVAAGLAFLTWSRAPRWAVVTLLLVLAVAATVVHYADPGGPVVGLYLVTAFAPLRLRRPTAVIVAAAAVLIFDLGLLIDAPNAPVFIAVVTGGAAFFFVFGALLRSEQEQRQRADRLVVELEASREAEKAAAAQAERARLAREMHDVLAHTLTGLVLQLDGARLEARGWHGDAALPEILSRAHALARDGLAEARRAVSTLRGDALPGPELLPALVDEHRRSIDGDCWLTVAGDPVPLSADARLAVYRTAQEALNNVRKHAPGARVDVSLAWTLDDAVLTVENASGGPAGDLTTSGAGYGLAGMAERAALLGGHLESGPTTTGYRVMLRVPLHRQEASR